MNAASPPDRTDIEIDQTTPGKLTRFHYGVMLWLGLLLTAEGYDLTAAAFATPWLTKAWAFSAGDAGPMLSASLFGMMLGAPLLGYFGDRSGRKRLILISTVAVCLGSLLSALSPSLTVLALARVIVGFGVGGVLTNSYSLAGEFAPKGRQATMVTVVAGASAAGGFLPALVSLWLAPHFGWQIIFVVGAALPALAVVGFALFVPESIRFLQARGRSVEAQRQASRMGVALPDDVETPPSNAWSVSGTGSIFAGSLRWITPLLWLIYCANMMSIYLVASWTPQVLSSPSDPAAGVLASSLLNVGGAIGGLTFGILIDRIGLRYIAHLYVLGALLIAAVGLTTGLVLNTAIFAAGLVVVGIAACLNAVAGRVYPIDRRSRGIGVMNGMARLGAVFGPLAGGVVLQAGQGPFVLYSAAALPLLVAAGLSIPMVLLVLRSRPAN